MKTIHKSDNRQANIHTRVKYFFFVYINRGVTVAMQVSCMHMSHCHICIQYIHIYICIKTERDMGKEKVCNQASHSLICNGSRRDRIHTGTIRISLINIAFRYSLEAVQNSDVFYTNSLICPGSLSSD